MTMFKMVDLPFLFSSHYVSKNSVSCNEVTNDAIKLVFLRSALVIDVSFNS